MSNSFTINGSHRFGAIDSELRAEIRTHTDNEEETSSILRSLERFGDDASIRYFEVTPKTSRRYYPGARAMSWTVHAVR